jgi:hypothetical protein
MKTGRMIWITMLLLLGTTTLFAQGRRNVNRPGYGNGYGPGTCIYALPGLTEEQKTKITELQIDHQKEMVEWRVKQRATLDPVDRNTIRGEMLKKVQVHREEVRNLLNEDQQKQLDLWQGQCYRGRGMAPGTRRPGGVAPYGGRGYRGGW